MLNWTVNLSPENWRAGEDEWGPGCTSRPEKEELWRWSDLTRSTSCLAVAVAVGPPTAHNNNKSLKNIWWPMPLFLIYYFDIFTGWHWHWVHFTYINLAWGGCMVEWTWSGVEACLFWSCIDVIVVRVKVSRGFEPFSPWGSTVRTLVNRPHAWGDSRGQITFTYN